MSKLNLEKKAKIVAHYLNTSDGYKNTANVFGISESVEALVTLLAWMHHEVADVTVFVERAQPEVADSLLFQRHEVGNNILDLRRFQNLLDN